jgi:hypothetical protein
MVFAAGLEEQDAAYALTNDEIRRAVTAAGAADDPVANGSCELR